MIKVDRFYISVKATATAQDCYYKYFDKRFVSIHSAVDSLKKEIESNGLCFNGEFEYGRVIDNAELHYVLIKVRKQ